MKNGNASDERINFYISLLVWILLLNLNMIDSRKSRRNRCDVSRRTHRHNGVVEEGGFWEWRSNPEYIIEARLRSRVKFSCQSLRYLQYDEDFQERDMPAPPLVVKWTKYDRVINFGRKKFRRFKLSGCQKRPLLIGSQLNIRRLRIEDSGLFSCQVMRNDTGEIVAQRIFALMVTNSASVSPPVKKFVFNDLSSLSLATTISCGSNRTKRVNLSCDYFWSGLDDVNVTWGNARAMEDRRNEKEASFPCEAATYTCSVGNPLGGYNQTFVIDGPEPETGKHVWHVTLIPALAFATTLSLIGFCRAIMGKRKKLQRPENGMFLDDEDERSFHPDFLVVVDGIEEEEMKEDATNYLQDTSYSCVSREVIDLVKTKEVSRERLVPGWHRNILGSGYFGHVYKGFLSAGSFNEKPVAVKVLRDGFRAGDFMAFVEEAKTLIKAEYHDNVISLVGTCLIDVLSERNSCSHQQAPLLLLELAEGGNLRTLLLKHKARIQNHQEPLFSHLEEQDLLGPGKLLSFSLQVSLGMEHLSERKILHRDLAARNILLTKNHVIKIGDFGLSKQMDEKQYYRACTRWEKPAKWTSPEALLHDKYTVKSDVWSFGVLLWEIYSLGDEPYPKVAPKQLYDYLSYGGRLPMPNLASNKMYDVMLHCWRWDPMERTSFANLTEFFTRCQNTKEDVVFSGRDDVAPPCIDAPPSPTTSGAPYFSQDRGIFLRESLLINPESYLPGFFARGNSPPRICRPIHKTPAFCDVIAVPSYEQKSPAFRKTDLRLTLAPPYVGRLRLGSANIPERFRADSGNFADVDVIKDTLVFENQTYVKSSRHSVTSSGGKVSTFTTGSPTTSSSSTSGSADDDSGFSKEFYCDEFTV